MNPSPGIVSRGGVQPANCGMISSMATGEQVDEQAEELVLCVCGCTLPWHDTRHGSPNGYSNFRCRCENCVTANSAYQLPMAHTRRSKGLPPGDRRHGTDNGYTNYGCRCEECKRGRREAAWRSRHDGAIHPAARIRDIAA